MPSMKLLVMTQIFDKNGKLRKTVEKESESFVLGWMQLIEIMLAHPYAGNSDSIQIKCTDGTSPYFDTDAEASNKFLAAEEIAQEVDHGIIVGTGTTPPTTDDFEIETPIAHGIAATQLQYGQCTVNAAAKIGANVDMTIVRAFTNGSGGTITVKEVGLALATICATPAEQHILVIRDAVDDAIANTEVYTVTYTFRTTV